MIYLQIKLFQNILPFFGLQPLSPQKIKKKN